MDAKEARAVALKRQQDVAAALEVIHGKQEEQRKQTLQDRIDSQVKYWEEEIAREAKKGKNYVQDLSFPHNDPKEEIWNACIAYFSAKGFHIGEYTTDEGYCIGDVSHVSISW